MNTAEKLELKTIGLALAYIDALVFTNDLNIEQGCVEVGGSVNAPFDDNDIYDAIITYKTPPVRERKGQDTHISSFPNLKTFTTEAVKAIYRRGLMR